MIPASLGLCRSSSTIGIVLGRGFTVYVSKKKVENVLTPAGIQIHGWHIAEDWTGNNFFVHRKYAKRALRLLEKAEIGVY